jgi:3-dehydroquinate synthase
MSTRISVTSQQGDYDVLIEQGCLASASARFAAVTRARRVLVVADEHVVRTHAATILKALQPGDWEVTLTAVRAEEPQKRMAAVEQIWTAALSGGLDRQSAIIAVGGGLTGDLAGFAAATYMRGIDVIQVPTTLLAMVDASIGGKTGINLAVPGSDHLGKNLAGSFWPPKLVLVDRDTLGTLPVREFRSGLAECVKHAVIGHPNLMHLLELHADSLREGQTSMLGDVLEQSIKAKQILVEQDEHEHGSRMLLNLGHTFAHAIEPIKELDLTHGEAVSVGLCAAMACAQLRGLMTSSEASRVADLLAGLHLPTCISTPQPIDDLLAAMHYDKKSIDGQLRLVLPTSNGAEVHDNVPIADITAAWRTVMPLTSD